MYLNNKKNDKKDRNNPLHPWQLENIDVRNIFHNENIRKRELVKGEMFLLRNLYK